MTAGAIKVEVVYAERGYRLSFKLRARAGETVSGVVRRSGILKQCPPEVNPLHGKGGIGIFGEQVALDATPADGDRIEIYRPLKRDPIEARRRRAARRA